MLDVFDLNLNHITWRIDVLIMRKHNKNSTPYIVVRGALGLLWISPKGRFAILHSPSRMQLDMHLAHCMDVSRRLLGPQEETKAFEGYFSIQQADEGDDYYLIAGVKK